jgi:hypothetical protein
MPRPSRQATKLQETLAAVRPDVEIIDVNFKVVRGPRRSWGRRIGIALLAIAIAALIGFAIPPAILLARVLWPSVGAV